MSWDAGTLESCARWQKSSMIDGVYGWDVLCALLCPTGFPGRRSLQGCSLSKSSDIIRPYSEDAPENDGALENNGASEKKSTPENDNRKLLRTTILLRMTMLPRITAPPGVTIPLKTTMLPRMAILLLGMALSHWVRSVQN